MDRVLPFKKNELEFLEAVTQKGEIKPELLTEDPDLQDKISRLPILLWKVQNVKQHVLKQTLKSSDDDNVGGGGPGSR